MKRLEDGDGRPELLALRALKLGDLLVAVPALHALRRGFPDHRMVLAVPGWLEPIAELVPADALLPTPGLDDPLPVPASRIDVAVNLHGNGGESAALLRALEPRRRLCHDTFGDEGPPWVDGILERKRWLRLVDWHGCPGDVDEVAIADPGPGPHAGAAVVHVGAFYGSRLWPADRFAAVARSLRDRGLEVVLTGGAAEAERSAHVAALAGLPGSAVLAGRIDLRDMASAAAHAAILVSVDTGAAHLASAFGTPSVVLFGPAPPEEWGPPPGPHVVLTDPALRVGDSFGTEPDPALLAVTVGDVLDAADRLLAAPRL
ncbi:MAG TPA: glycosyltransferase family 9 protein [Naasia sp.]